MEIDMKGCCALEYQITRRILPTACAAVAAVVLAVALPQTSHAHRVTPPAVPADLQVEAGNKAFLKGHAVGTQNYICLPAVPPASGFVWTLFTPQATLFDEHGKQIITHFFSPNPNPSDNGAIRATWQHSRDTSTVWAAVVGNPSTDPNFVAPGAIAWLLLRVVGARDGAFWGDTLTPTTFIHRVNTQGNTGVAW
jgi:Protein of unknown function (DUF3455)